MVKMTQVPKTGFDPSKDQYYMSSNSHDKWGTQYSLIHNEEAYECVAAVYEKE